MARSALIGLVSAHRAAGRRAEAAHHARLGEAIARDAQHHLLARQVREALGVTEEETEPLLREAC
ncbi:hypothetical protein [Micromonospora sp. NPDC023633]|uniref:hypothetical protein n=1 Tax=Micromonospora sp. NPDC023633 TaxID=3154320 RepID=UPI00340576B7